MSIPASIKSVEKSNFRFCENLTEINVAEDNTVYKSIDGVLFNKSANELICYPQGKAGAYRIPDGVTDISCGAFEDCEKLTSIYIPESVSSISVYNTKYQFSFSDCYNLEEINVDENNRQFKSIEGVLFNKSGRVLLMCPHGMKGDYFVPDGVKEIGSRAFNYCTKLKTIHITSSVDNCNFEDFIFMCDATVIHD